MTRVYYVVDLAPDFYRKSLTIHGAWSHRHGGKFKDGWEAIENAGPITYAKALSHIIVESNDSEAFEYIKTQLRG